jgi:hypothetical protein
MSAATMAIITVLATGAVDLQAGASAAHVDRSRPRPDVYYPPLPPAPVQPAVTESAGTAPGTAPASPSTPGCRRITS